MKDYFRHKIELPPLPDVSKPKVPEFVPKHCWRCNAPVKRPSLDEQVALLAEIQDQHGPLFHLHDDELERLRDLLHEGDVIALLKNITQHAAVPMYGTIAVHRGDEVWFIPRSLLQPKSKKPAVSSELGGA